MGVSGELLLECMVTREVGSNEQRGIFLPFALVTHALHQAFYLLERFGFKVSGSKV